MLRAKNLDLERTLGKTGIVFYRALVAYAESRFVVLPGLVHLPSGTARTSVCSPLFGQRGMEEKETLTRTSEFLTLGDGLRTFDPLIAVTGIGTVGTSVTILGADDSEVWSLEDGIAMSVLSTPRSCWGLCRACTHSGGDGAWWE